MDEGVDLGCLENPGYQRVTYVDPHELHTLDGDRWFFKIDSDQMLDPVVMLESLSKTKTQESRYTRD
jgi:hypothetical protein